MFNTHKCNHNQFIFSYRSQGKTYKFVGICLTTDFFSHGQLYVSLSRVGSSKCVKIFKPKSSPSFGFMKNVVYEEVLSTELPSKSHPYKEGERESAPFFPPVSSIQGLKRKPFFDQKAEASNRLKEVGFTLRPETESDGNCFIHGVLDQMRLVII